MPRGGERQTDPRHLECARDLNEDHTMKKGRNLEALVSELLRQAESKRDFLTPANRLTFDCNGTGPTLEVDLSGAPEAFPLKDTGHQQLAERLEIPKTYYDRMREEAPFLLEENVRTWLRRSEKQFLVRTLDGQARAILSDRYRVLDNDDLANVAMPVLVENDFEIISAEITERKFYLKAKTARIQGEVKPGDVVEAGIVISNSEIGQGTLKIEPLLYFLVCSNGLVMPEASLRRQHVGRHIGELEAAAHYHEETRRADDAAFWLKVRDVLTGTLKQPAFSAHLQKLQGAAAEPIAADPIAVVEVTAKKFRFTDPEKNSVLRHFLGGHNHRQELTKYGLMQAVTRASQDIDDYDRATEFEQLGGQIIELAPGQWKTIAEARGA
jgi:hypothetical protein